MIFYDNYEAPLTAGSYRFVLQQTVSLEGDEPRHYYQDQRFEVLAPRYSIDGDEIQAYFPPSGGVADYKNVLPHLVLAHTQSAVGKSALAATRTVARVAGALGAGHH